MAKKTKKEEPKVTQEEPQLEINIPEEMREKLREESEEMQGVHDATWRSWLKGGSAPGDHFNPACLADSLALKDSLKEAERRIDVPTPYGSLPLDFVFDSVYGKLGQNIPLLLQALLKEMLYRRLMRI